MRFLCLIAGFTLCVKVRSTESRGASLGGLCTLQGAPIQVRLEHLIGQRPQSRPRTCWRDCTSKLDWEGPGITQEDLESLAEDKEF